MRQVGNVGAVSIQTCFTFILESYSENPQLHIVGTGYIFKDAADHLAAICKQQNYFLDLLCDQGKKNLINTNKIAEFES